jgi:hypothetical protein
MKIIEGIKHKGRPFTIPDSTREDLPEFFKEMGYTVGAEIGVYKAEFTEKFCKAGLKMYGIDPYHSYNSAGRAAKDQKRQEFLYGHARRVLDPYTDCTIIRKTSMDAVSNFKERSLDFVYIDGDHSFKHVAQDIYEWVWKVRKGGVISGHDYRPNTGAIEKQIRHVGRVVDAYTLAFEIKEWYEVGTNDHASSWFWIIK